MKRRRVSELSRPSIRGPARSAAQVGPAEPTIRQYAPHADGIREWRPLDRRFGAVALTEQISPSIRSVRGWLYPLEHYDKRMEMTVLEQYVELLLVMGSETPVDFESIAAVMREARARLSDDEYDKLLSYKALVESARMGIPAAIPP